MMWEEGLRFEARGEGRKRAVAGGIKTNNEQSEPSGAPLRLVGCLVCVSSFYGPEGVPCSPTPIPPHLLSPPTPPLAPIPFTPPSQGGGSAGKKGLRGESFLLPSYLNQNPPTQPQFFFVDIS